jgi:hypothetical protein
VTCSTSPAISPVGNRSCGEVAVILIEVCAVEGRAGRRFSLVPLGGESHVPHIACIMHSRWMLPGITPRGLNKLAIYVPSTMRTVSWFDT